MRTNGNGQAAGQEREHIIREAVYYAAVYGWYDTSPDAEEAGILTISVADIGETPGNILPPDQAGVPAGATHQFYVMINATAYIVTRYPGQAPNQAAATYNVELGDRMPKQHQEAALRAAVLDAAMWEVTGEGAGYQPATADQEARAAALAELLAEGQADQAQAEQEADSPQPHAIVRDEEPSIYLAPGSPDQPAPLVSRQWYVEIGPLYACHVGLIGYNEEGGPEFVTVEADQVEEDGEL